MRSDETSNLVEQKAVSEDGIIPGSGSGFAIEDHEEGTNDVEDNILSREEGV